MVRRTVVVLYVGRMPKGLGSNISDSPYYSAMTIVFIILGLLVLDMTHISFCLTRHK
jgi:hypothetical protein